jgi:hypothetical protein
MRIRSLFLASGKQRKIVLAAVLLLGLTISAFSMSRWATTRRSTTQEPALSETRVAAQEQSSFDAPGLQGNPALVVKGIRFTIHPTGIDPQEIVLEAGRYRIAVDNRSGANEANIQLDRSNGQALVNAPISARKLGWRGVLQLTPGEYNLKLVGQPSRTGKIIVKSN